MTFAEAYKEMLVGKKVRRPSFKGYWFINQETGIFTIHLESGKDIQYGKLGLTVVNCLANDWELVDD